WVVEIAPSHQPRTGPADDATSGARYMYDLELDANGNLLGGEWYQNQHPDFVWTPLPGAHARAAGEATQCGATWNATGPVPAAWRLAPDPAPRRGADPTARRARASRRRSHAVRGHVDRNGTRSRRLEGARRAGVALRDAARLHRRGARQSFEQRTRCGSASS